MNSIYKGHLPGSLGLLEVLLSPSDGLQVEYTALGAKKAKDVGTLQAAVDADFEDDDVIDRLNYATFLNGVIAERIKAAREKAAPDEKPVRERDLPTGQSTAAATIPITAENVGDLPESLRPETRERIFANLGIEDPKSE